MCFAGVGKFLGLSSWIFSICGMDQFFFSLIVCILFIFSTSIPSVHTTRVFCYCPSVLWLSALLQYLLHEVRKRKVGTLRKDLLKVITAPRGLQCPLDVTYEVNCVLSPVTHHCLIYWKIVYNVNRPKWAAKFLDTHLYIL